MDVFSSVAQLRYVIAALGSVFYVVCAIDPARAQVFAYGISGGTTATATATATGTPTGTASATFTATATATGTPTGTASATFTATATATGTPTGTASATLTRTPTQTGTVTSTRTVTPTRSVTPTFTIGPPAISAPLEAGDSRIGGMGPPNRMDGQILICLIGGANQMPSVPPCTAPDSVLGMCGTNGAGQFVDNGMLGCPVPPLQPDQCIYAFDTVTMLISTILCVTAPAAAPALSTHMIAVALAILALIAGIGLRRRHRPHDG